MITDYASLKQAILDWPDLSTETNLVGVIDTIVGLAEARINGEVRLREGITTRVEPDTGTPFSDYTLPDDYLEMDRLMGPSGETLFMRPAEELLMWGSEPDDPVFYAIDGRQLLFAPSVTNFSYRYYQRIPSLSDTSSNWLLTRAPDLYLYASLIHVSIFSKEDDREQQRYEKMYGLTFSRLVREDAMSIQPRSQSLYASVPQGKKRRT